MLKQYHQIVGGAFRVVDAIVIGLAWLLSYWLRFEIEILPVTKGYPAFSKYASLTPLVMVLWVLVFQFFNVYQSRRMLRRTHEVQLLLKAHGAALLGFIALTYLISEYKYSRLVVLTFGLSAGSLLIFFRLTLRNALRMIRKRGHNLRHVLAIGEGPALETVAHRFERFPELGLRVLGSLTRTGDSQQTNQASKVLGSYEQAAELIAKHQPDTVLISLPRQDYAILDQILHSLRDATVDIQMIPDVHEFVTLGCEIEDFDGMPVVNLNRSPLAGWGALAKRLTDIALSTLALVLLAPLLLFIAILVKLSSRGPVLYRQERMGIDGTRFDMLKFRSMGTDAESESGAVWAKENDPRRTRFGTFLRSTSLDELPQLINILRGEMSIVGPRPERPVFVDQFKGEIPNYMLRHKVKSGLTGWAQVNGWRGNTSLERRIECDLFYIRNWSYFLDIKIIFMTVWKGFINKNAY